MLGRTVGRAIHMSLHHRGFGDTWAQPGAQRELWTAHHRGSIHDKLVPNLSSLGRDEQPPHFQNRMA